MPSNKTLNVAKYAARWGEDPHLEITKNNELFRQILTKLSESALESFKLINISTLILLGIVLVIDTSFIAYGKIEPSDRLLTSEILMAIVAGVVIETISLVVFLGKQTAKALNSKQAE